MKKMHYLLILDRSGSMGSIRKNTIEGINTQIDSIKNNGLVEGMSISASLLLFDTRGGSSKDWFEFLYANKPSAELTPIEWDQFVPSGSTPLNDAIAHGVKVVQGFADSDTDILVSIFTDGQENASRDFTREQIMSMVQALEETKKWTFTFVGAGGIDQVKATAKSYGIAQDMVMNYDASPEGATQSFGLMAASVSGCTNRMMAGGQLRSIGGFYEAPENFQNLIIKT